MSLSLAQKIQKISTDRPNATAFNTAGTLLSYGQLQIQIENWRSELNRLKIPQYSRVALIAPNQPEVFSLFLACLLSDRTFVPIDPSQKNIELNFTLRLVNPAAVLIPFNYTDKQICLDSNPSFSKSTTESPSYSIFLNSIQVQNQARSSGIVLLTSGSTGDSKGVFISEPALNSRFSLPLAASKVDDTDRLLCSLPLTHSYAYDLVLPMLIAGGEIHLIDPSLSNPTTIFSIVQKERITIYSAPPLFYKIATMIPTHIKYDLSSLKYLHTGSAPLLPDVGETIYNRYGIPIQQGYGLTETGFVCFNQYRASNFNFQSIGKPWPHVEFQIDANGQLLIKSPGNFSHYITQDSQNSGEYTSAHWFATQDLVDVDENGDYYVTGRLNEFINIAGTKVYPAEIEKVCNQHPHVAQAAVTAYQSPERGEMPVLHLVLAVDHPRPIDKLTQDILAHLQLHLAEYKMPKDVMIHDVFPTNSIGKTNKSSLSEKYKLSKINRNKT